MQRLAALGAVIAALLTTGGASAADVDWTKLPYFDAPNMREYIATDSTWSGSKAVKTGHFNFPADSFVAEGQETVVMGAVLRQRRAAGRVLEVVSRSG